MTDRHLSQADVAKRMEISPTTLNHMLRDDRDLMLSSVYAICRALNLQMEVILRPEEAESVEPIVVTKHPHYDDDQPQSA